MSRRAFQGELISAVAYCALPLAGDDRLTRVALLLSGVITDGGWAELAYDGLKAI